MRLCKLKVQAGRAKWRCQDVWPISFPLSRTLPSSSFCVCTCIVQTSARPHPLTQLHAPKDEQTAPCSWDGKLDLYWAQVPSCEPPTGAGAASIKTLKCIPLKFLWSSLGRWLLLEMKTLQQAVRCTLYCLGEFNKGEILSCSGSLESLMFALQSPCNEMSHKTVYQGTL